MKVHHPPNNEWTNVYFDRLLYDKVGSTALYRWCDENCKGKVYFGTNWSAHPANAAIEKMNCVANFVFPEDATLFTLKWL